MFLFLSLLSICFADVAFVTFSGGDLSGSIRFEQDEGQSEVTITSNVLDATDSHGASITWTTYSDFVDNENGGTCSDKGNAVLDLTTLLGTELRIGYTSYTTDKFAVRDLYDTSIVLGVDVVCAGISEIPEALRLYSTISWQAAVGNEVIEQSRVKTAETFSVDVSRVLAVPYYPVTVESTMTNLPTTTTDVALEGYVIESLRHILDLSDIDDVDVDIFPTATPTTKDITFVVTSYTNGTYIFLYDHISSSPTFLPQLLGSINVLGAFTEGAIWQADMVINNVDLKTTIALTTADVSSETYTALDIDDTIPDYRANLATMDPPGTLVSYTIHSETKSPSASPTKFPSKQPSVSPSAVPSVSPSSTPSSSPSTAPICGPQRDDYLGDPLIQLNNFESKYASGNFELTLVFPPKYTASEIEFIGDTQGTYTFNSGDTEDPWRWTDKKCLRQFTVTLPWSEIQDGSIGITWNGATNTFDGVLDVHLTELIQKTGSQTLGDSHSRDVEYEMPFSILMHTSIVAETDLTITMSDATLSSRVLNGLQVVVPDGANPSVTVLFCTEMPYPWILEVPSSSSDVTVSGTDVVSDTASLAQLSSENCDQFGNDCKQCWQASWEVSQVCKESGDYTITIPAQYLQVPPYTEEVNVDVGITLSLMPSCEVGVATIEPTGSLVMYSDSTYSSTSLVFYIDSEAWGRITVDALQGIESLTLDSLLVKQDGVSQNLQTNAFEYQEVARTTGDVATIDFKNRFTITELKGEITGKPTVITADLTITYVDGTRRRLEITTGENDVPTFTEAESTIVLLQGPCNSPNGYLDEIRTEQCIGSSQQQVLQCLATGWAALSECPTELLAEEANLVSSNDQSTWRLLTVALASIVVFGFVAYWLVTSYCLTDGKRDKYSFQQSPSAVDTI